MRLIKLITKELTYIAGLLMFLIILPFLLLEFFWDSHSVNTLNGARELLKQHGSHEHKVALNECVKLIKSGKKVTLRGSDIPKPLNILSPEYVRTSMFTCEINLYKVPGKGIAYWVTESNDGHYELSWADYFKSFESYIITIE